MNRMGISPSPAGSHVIKSAENITHEQQQELLALARATAQSALRKVAVATSKSSDSNVPAGGAFVTFWNGTELRGCVGSMKETSDLFQTLTEVTRASLTDRRFSLKPIQSDELEVLTIEISVLSPLERTTDPLSLVLGTHGIFIRNKVGSGCFLPKVAIERGWSAHQFLTNCCQMKAGMPADAWKHPDTEVFLFTAQVFSDKGYVHTCC